VQAQGVLAHADQVAQAISESSAAARVVKEDPRLAAREDDLVAQAIRESIAVAWVVDDPMEF
jgi:sulfur transfer complex TusBCD TusB component (DsrH family)